MAAEGRTYSASDRAAQLVPIEVEIDGKSWRVKRTGKALKKIIELAPEENEEASPAENIDVLYTGLSFLLVDAEGNNPDPTALSDELDFEVAQELMEQFVPRRDEGNSEENSSEKASSTPT